MEGNPKITLKKMIEAGKLDKSEIITINITGPDHSKKLYGGKAKDGAVVIKTKSGGMVGASLSNNDFTSTVKVYPSPFNDQLNVNFFLSEASEVEISIHDMNGKEIDRINKNFGRGDQKILMEHEKIT